MADDVNISPEMIENLMNMFKNSTNTDNNSAENNNSSIDFNEFLKNFSSNNSDNINTDKSSAHFGNIDFQTIMRIKSIMDSLNSKDDPNSNLLYSLKPYLRKSRQDKLDQYINMLKVAQISKIFKGDPK